jgi:hypothetical protein
MSGFQGCDGRGAAGWNPGGGCTAGVCVMNPGVWLVDRDSFGGVTVALGTTLRSSVRWWRMKVGRDWMISSVLVPGFQWTSNALAFLRSGRSDGIGMHWREAALSRIFFGMGRKSGESPRALSIAVDRSSPPSKSMGGKRESKEFDDIGRVGKRKFVADADSAVAAREIEIYELSFL